MNIILLAGTGYIGTRLSIFLKQKNIDVVAYNKLQYNSANVNDNVKLLNTVKEQDINYIVDFSRFTKKQLLSLQLLLAKLPLSCRYINISSYAVVFPNAFKDDFDYVFTKKQSEKAIRRSLDFNIRLPRITTETPEIVSKQLIEDNNYKLDYFYISTPNKFNNFLYAVILLNIPGTYIMPSKKIYIYLIKTV